MRVAISYAAGLVVTALVLVVAVSCAPQQPITPEEASYEGDVLTAEQVIRHHDLKRLWALDEFALQQQELDIDLASLDQDITEVDYEARTKRERTLAHIGRATWSFLTVAVTLGMTALPFLI
jgi:hypothetical protein